MRWRSRWRSCRRSEASRDHAAAADLLTRVDRNLGKKLRDIVMDLDELSEGFRDRVVATGQRLATERDQAATG